MKPDKLKALVDKKMPVTLGELAPMVRAAGWDDRDVGTVWSTVSSKLQSGDKLEAGIVLFSTRRSSTSYVLVAGVNLRNTWWTRQWVDRDPLALVNSSLEGVAIDEGLGIGAHGSGIEDDLKDVFRLKLPAWLKAGVVLNRT